MDFDCNVMYAVWLPRTAMRFHQNRPSALYSYTMTKNRKDKPKLYLGWHVVACSGVAGRGDRRHRVHETTCLTIVPAAC